MASKLSRNILQSAALSGVNPSTGQYLSSSQRKAIFRRSKISSANVFARSSSDLVAANSSAIVKYQDKSLSAKLDKVISYFERREREDKKIKKRELKLLREQKVERERQRELLRRKEKEEGLEGGFGKKLAKTLIAPVTATAAKTQGILQRLLDFFLVIFAGWLTDKGLLAIKLNAEGNVEGLKNLAAEVGIALGAVTATLGLLNGGLLGIAATIGGLALGVTTWLATRPFAWARGLMKSRNQARTNLTRQTGTGRGRTTVTQGRGGRSQPRNPLRPRPPVTQGRGGKTTFRERFGIKPGIRSRFGQMMRGSRPGSGAARSGLKPSGAGTGAGAAMIAMTLLPLFEKPINNLLYDSGYMGYSKLSDGEMLLELEKYEKKVSAHEKRINEDEERLSNAGFFERYGNILGEAFSSFLPKEMDKDINAFAALYRLSQNRGLIDSEGNLTDKGGKIEVPTAKVTRVTPTLQNLQLALDKLDKSKSGTGESIVIPGVGVVVRGTNLGGLVHQDKYLDPDGRPLNQKEFFGTLDSVQRKLQRKQTEQKSVTTVVPTVESQTSQVNPIPLRRPVPDQLPEPAPNVIYRRVGGEQNQSAPLKTGSATDVPSIPSSNPDNFYTMYSQMNYNVVE